MAGLQADPGREGFCWMGQRRSQDFRDLLGALQGVRIPSETGRIEPHCLQAKSKADVDRLHSELLAPRSIKILYGGPKEYPEYRKGYYAVYFEDPDRIKLEFVH